MGTVMTDFPKKALDDWQALAGKECRGKPLEGLTAHTPEGIAVKPLYTQADLEGLAHLDSLPQDYEALYAAGAVAIFGPGTVITKAAAELLDTLAAQVGEGA